MTNNTTSQDIFIKQKAIVAGGAIKGVGATSQSHFQTLGTFICNGSTPVTVTEPNFVNIAQVIVISLNTVGGTVGALPAIQTVTAGTGFTVAGTAGDTSTYNYRVFGV